MKRESLYVHGGTPQRDMIRLGVPLRPVLDFSINLNPLGPPPIIREKWQGLFETVEHYPSVEGDGVAHYYETVCNISARNFLAGNGSTEMIYLAPRVLGFKRAGVITPSYHDYERASLLAGATVVRWPLSSHDDFAFPTDDQLRTLLKNVDALWIARPNNPTGNIFPKRRILEFAHRFPEKWFLVDEAFVQFLADWGPAAGIDRFLLPLAAHEFPMPADHRLRFEDPNHTPQLAGRQSSPLFQRRRQNCQRPLFFPAWPHDLIVLAHHHI